MADLHEQNQIRDAIQDLSNTVPAPAQTSDSLPASSTTDAPLKDDVRIEEVKISGSDLVEKVKELIHEGNIRRIILKTEEGNTLIEIPLTIGVVGGVVGAAMFPIVAALGAIGALVARITIVIEKKV